MHKKGQDLDDRKQDWQNIDARVLGQVLAAQNILFVLPDTKRIAGFFSQALVSVPGATACRVCLGDASVQVGLVSDVCRECENVRKAAGESQAMPFGFKCRLAEEPGICVIALETSEHTFGFIVFRKDTTGIFESYTPFITNLANYIALSLENRLQKNLIESSAAAREKIILELKEALAKVKTLSGMLPICATCKKIRDDKGYWNRVEAYISEHADVVFSHGMCPDCGKKAYEELDIFMKEQGFGK